MKVRVFLLTVSVLGFCAPLAAQVTSLQLGAPQDGSIPMVGQSYYYRVDLASAADLVLTVSNTADAEDRFEVYIKKDGVPSPTDYLAASNSDSVEQLLNLPGLGAGSYYLQVRWSVGPSWWNDWGEYRILARSTGDLPRLALGEAQEAAHPMVGQSYYYRVDLASAAYLVLTVSNTADAEDRFEIYIKKDGVPSPTDYLAASNSDSVEQLLNLPGLAAGSYYLQVRWSVGPSWWNDWGEYRILARSAGDLPRLVLGEAQESAVPMVGQSYYYRVDLASAADLVLTVSNTADAEDRFEVYIKKDGVPSPTDYLAASNSDSVEQLLNLPGLAAGSYYLQVRWSVGWSWWNDWGEYRIVSGALGFTVAQVSPQRVGNAGSVTLTIRGAGFYEGATVRLAREGQSEILPVEIAFISQSLLRARFDLSGVEPGPYDVVFTNPGGQPATLSSAVTIEAGGEPELWLQLVGRDTIRAGRRQTFNVAFGNKGNVDAVGVPLWIAGMPKGSTIVPGFEITSPPALDEDASLDPSEVPITFETDKELALPLFITYIPSGTMRSLAFTLTVPNTGDFQLRAWFNPPYFGSPLHAEVVECLAAIGSVIFDLAGIVLPLHCAESVTVLLHSLINQSIGMAASTATGESSVLSIGQMLFSVLQSVAICAGEASGVGKLITAMAAGLMWGLDIQLAWDQCKEALAELAAAARGVSVVASFDPNDKGGPAGFDAVAILPGERQRFIPPTQFVAYMVFYENLQNATAAAQEVLITDQLDANLDWVTFSLGQFQVAEQVVSIPQASHNFSATLDLRPTMPALVDVTCTYDPATGRAEWLFRGRDPDTGELGDFLPPNTDDVDPRGRGWVSYTVSPKPGLPTGTVIRNKATIDFEVGVPPDPMETPEWFNTIDAGEPSSAVSTLPETHTSTEFDVSWTGQDDEGGSGIREYAIYVSTDDGPYEVWLADTTETSATVTGEPGHTYRFYSRATDNVGHVEPAPADADATTAVFIENVAPEPPPEPEPPEEPGPTPEPEPPPGQEVPPESPPRGTCGACGSGASVAMIMSFCVLGFLRLQRRREA